MKRLISVMTMGTALLLGTSTGAQVPAGAPAGTTGLCKDGTYYSGASKKGACHGHKGVQDWYGAPGGAARADAKSDSKTDAKAGSKGQSQPDAKAPNKDATTPDAASAGPGKSAAPGGGPGLVWVNTPTKVYHCPGDKWYGKTKEGQYLSESEAKAKGNRADHSKACQ